MKQNDSLESKRILALRSLRPSLAAMAALAAVGLTVNAQALTDAQRTAIHRSNGVYSAWEAVRAGDEEVLAARIREGADVTSANEQGDTPLHLAAVRGSLAMARSLLAAGADPLALDAQGRTPSRLAATDELRQLCEAGEAARSRELAAAKKVEAGDADGLRVALEDGVNPDALAGGDGSSLLQLALVSKQPEAVRLLLEAGASPDLAGVVKVGKGPGGREARKLTPLQVAIALGDADSVRLLLDCGADVRAGDGPGLLHLAVWSRQPAIVKALLPSFKGENYSPDSGPFGAPVAMAIRFGLADIVQTFLEAGLDPNDSRFEREPLLIMAVRQGDAEIARALLSAGADASAHDSEGRTAADYADGELNELFQ